MDWHQLTYFQILADLRNITKASEELVLSQPALSRSISRLEEEIGVPLFERKSRGVVLNRYGKVFLQHVNRALSEIEEAKLKINDMVDPFHGTISLAFIQTLGSSYIPDLISDFKEHQPEIKFQLSQDTTNVILEQIDAAEIDIGFCSPQESLEHLSSIPIVAEELVLIVPIHHSLAGLDQVDLCEVAEEPFVLFKTETALREVIEGLCYDAGFYPRVVFEGLDERTVADLVGANLGVALVPVTQGLDTKKVSIIRIRKPRCLRVIHMVWRTKGYMSPVVEKFRAFVENARGLHE